MRPPLANFRAPQHAYTQKLVAALPRHSRLSRPDLLCFHARRGTRSHSLLGPFRVRRLAAAFSPVHPEPPSQLNSARKPAFHESWSLSIEYHCEIPTCDVSFQNVTFRPEDAWLGICCMLLYACGLLGMGG